MNAIKNILVVAAVIVALVLCFRAFVYVAALGIALTGGYAFCHRLVTDKNKNHQPNH